MIYIGMVGSRERDSEEDYMLVRRHIIEYKVKFISITIVSGGADGIDSIARRVADDLGIPIIEHLPKYEEYSEKGNDIYSDRNKLIAIDSKYLNAYHINMSGGTMNTVRQFKELGKNIVDKLRIYNKVIN